MQILVLYKLSWSASHDLIYCASFDFTILGANSYLFSILSDSVFSQSHSIADWTSIDAAPTRGKTINLNYKCRVYLVCIF